MKLDNIINIKSALSDTECVKSAEMYIIKGR